MKLAALICLCLCGCVSVTATRTTNGVTDSLTIKAFLENVQQGVYTNSAGMAISVNSATPDQQTISVLAGSVTTLATLFATHAPTNAPAK